MFCSLTYQPGTLNSCRIWVSLSRDTQTQPIPPQFLNLVQSQANEPGSIRKSRTVDHPKTANDWFLCNISGFVSSENRCYFDCWQWHNITLLQMSKLSTFPALIWYFSFRLARLIFLLSVHGGGKIPHRSGSRWENRMFWKLYSSIYPLHLPHKWHNNNNNNGW